MNEPEIGKEVRYQARHTGQMVISNEESGAVMLYIPYALVNAGFNFSGTYAAVIAQKDGTPSESTIVNIAKIFGIKDTDDFYGIQDIEPNTDGTPEFELAEWYEDTYKGRTTTKPRWINTMGGAFRKTPLDAAGKKKLQAKLGSRLKAILAEVDHSGATPEPAAEKEEEEELLPKGEAGGMPSRSGGGMPQRRQTSAAVRSLTQEEVWELLEAREKPKTDKAKQELADNTLFATADKLFPPPHELSPQDWGKVADELEL
jgi:hypothetical protein